MSRPVLSSELDRTLRADASLRSAFAEFVSRRAAEERADFDAAARAAALNTVNAPRAAYLLGRLSVLEELDGELAKLGA